MPTENRSSNTEQMVSVPREHDLKICRTPLDDLLSGAKTGEIRDCSDREFAAGDTVLLREVDDARAYTGRTTRRTITHVQKYYGLPDHLCVLSYAQHQGEPVALPARKDTTQHWAEPGGVHKAEGWNAYHEELARLGPLYTHPAPVQQGEPVARVEIGADRNAALTITDENWLRSLKDHGAHQLVPLYANAGEVERLRASEKSLAKDLAESLKQQCADMRTINTLRADLEGVKSSRDAFAQNAIDLRAQLAERGARLGAIAGWTTETRSAVLEAFQDELNESASYAWYDAAIADLMKLVESLSTSADPSNDLCAEGAHEFVPFRSKCVKCGEPYSAEPSAREAQALKDESRLGIERLPAEPSAPDELEGVEDLARRIAARVKARAALERKP